MSGSTREKTPSERQEPIHTDGARRSGHRGSEEVGGVVYLIVTLQHAIFLWSVLGKKKDESNRVPVTHVLSKFYRSL